MLPPEALARPAHADEARLWARTVMEGFREDAPGMESLEELFAVMSAASGATPYLAWQGAEPAGGASLSIHGDAAMFYGDSTLPDFKVQVGAGRASGTSYFRHFRTAQNHVAQFDM